MRLAIVGSRHCPGLSLEQVVEKIPINCTEIVSGGSRGVDDLARQAAQALGIPLKVYRPDYARHGRAAPLMRNDLIVQRAHYVLAFWDGSSRGTAYTIRECIRRHVPVRVILLPKPPKSAGPGP